ncbi:MAG TPA: glycoside hydrolase family 3 N-terminal domain-containing protein [Saprospiraceae bacterium]|nr:glycoside hydrolase family 3 N-terminal domain-containing protein [Saprospiraceae bacterium]
MYYLKTQSITLITILLVLIFSGIRNNISSQPFQYKFLNPDLSIEERTEDIISRMTLDEKIDQLLYNAPAIDRLGIPEYNWWNECLHGVARNGRATVFPQAIGMGATWDTDLIYRVGRAISMEARAKYNVSIAHNMRGRYQGLTFWSPNVNIFRDPRWGRGQETYGEDPLLTGAIGAAFVRGLQGDHPRYLQASAMAKHYAVHSGPEALRHEFDAVVNMKDLWETYLPAFQKLVVDAKVESIMGAYNRTNGDPCNAHPYLMTEVLRNKWGFKGHYVSDCWALVDFHNGHNIVKTPAEAAAMALNAGTNLNCGNTYPYLREAIEKGYTSEAIVDENLRWLLPTRFKLGLFDPPGTVPFDTIGTDWIRHPSHTKLALETAEKSIVLLKNENNTLPIRKDARSVFVTGPTAAHTQTLLANYYGVSEDLRTILEGIVANAAHHTSIPYIQAALLDEENRNPQDWFSGMAAEAEYTVACLGLSQLIEGEEGESIMSRHLGDRVEIGLPQNQINFFKKMRANSRKLIVVITGGSAISIPEIHELADAVLYVWYPGEQGGIAVGNVLYGKTNPSGKLPVTFVNSVEDLPPYEDYNMANRTYKYLETNPLYPFGFGLSYTRFQYENLNISNLTMSMEEELKLDFSLVNTGAVAGDEVVQLYVTALDSKVDSPQFDLKSFSRVPLSPGESKKVQFTIGKKELEVVNNEGERVVYPGKYKIYVGGSLPSERSLELGAPQYLQATIEVK